MLLFGSEGHAKIFTSNSVIDDCDLSFTRTNLPTAVCEAVDPIVLDIKLTDICECNTCDCEIGELPSFISTAFPNGLVLNSDARRVYITLGQFTIVRLERESQLLIPVIDYCMPEKECSNPGSEDPCDLFRLISFPVNEFFPPDTLENSLSYNTFQNKEV